MRLGIVLLSCIYLLSACGGGSANSTNYPVSLVPTDGQTRSKELLDQATVSCGDSTCPTEVALLAMGTKSMAGSCTSFLISPTLALTNSHCIPPEVRAKTQKPIDTMRLLFPATADSSARTVTVAEVIFFSKINPEDKMHIVGKLPDYALLRLNESVDERGYLELSREGVPDNFALSAYSVTPTSDTAIAGTLGKHACESMMGSAIQPSYENVFTSVISFSGCEIKHGNSGSPLVDANGKVRAILQASVDKNMEDITAETYGVFDDDFLNLATNISCLNLPGVQMPADTECSVDIPQVELNEGLKEVITAAGKDPIALKRTNDDLNNKFTAWTKSPASSYVPFHWKLVPLTSDATTFIPVPLCYTSEKLNSTYDLTAPEWTLKGTLDSRFRFGMSITENDLINFMTITSDQSTPRAPTNLTYSCSNETASLSAVPFCGN